MRTLGDKVVTIRTALLEYLEYFGGNPCIAFEDDNDLPKIPLDHTKDEEFALDISLNLVNY
jgi:hypothetical protein